MAPLPILLRHAFQLTQRQDKNIMIAYNDKPSATPSWGACVQHTQRVRRPEPSLLRDFLTSQTDTDIETVVVAATQTD